MKPGDIVSVWLKGDDRIITGELLPGDGPVKLLCRGEDGSTTTWTIHWANILAAGLCEPPPEKS